MRVVRLVYEAMTSTSQRSLPVAMCRVPIFMIGSIVKLEKCAREIVGSVTE